MTKKRLYKNIILLLFVQFSNYIAPLLVLPYLTRVLGVEGFGIIVMAMSMTSIAMILTDFGFNLSGTYWIANHQKLHDLVAKYIGAVVIIKATLSVVSIGGVILYSALFEHAGFSSAIILAIALIILSQGFQFTWFFQGIERMKNVTFSLVTAKLLYMLAIFMLVDDANDTAIVLYCLAGSNIVSTLIGFALLRREGYWIGIPSPSTVKDVFTSSIGFFMSRAAVGVYTSASTFIVGSMCGVHQAALYSSAEKLYQAGQGVTAPVSQALYPYLARSGDINSLYKFVIVLIIPLTIGCSFFYYYSEYVLSWFYGEEFGQAYEILQIFLICSVINFVSVNFGYPAFSTINKLYIVNRGVYLAGVLQLCILFFLSTIGILNALNVARSVLVVEFAVMVYRIVAFQYLKSR